MTARHDEETNATETEGVEVRTVEADSGRWSRAWFANSERVVRSLCPDLVVAESTGAGELVREWPTVTHLHGNHRNELSSSWSAWGRRRTRRAFRRALGLGIDYIRWRPQRIAMGGVIALSAREALLAHRLYGVSRSEVAVIGNPVADIFFAERGQRNLRIVFAGRLHPSKGPGLLLEAFASSKASQSGYTLEFAGEGAFRSDLVRTAARLGISGSVVFHGYLQRDALAAFLGTSRIACFPAIGREDFSVALVEAMASGCAILASSQAGVTGIVTHPRATATKDWPAGVVPHRTASAWATAQDGLAGDPAAALRHARPARTLAGSFSEVRVDDSIGAFYSTQVRVNRLR